jgi:hypothetical protein
MKTRDVLFLGLGLILMFVFFKSCENKPNKPINYSGVIENVIPRIQKTVETKTVEEVIKDTIIYRDRIRIVEGDANDKEVQHLREMIGEILKSVDDTTLALITKKYYDKNIHVDTIKIDTIGYVIIKDTVQKNQILNRRLEYNIFIPATKCKERSFLSAGASGLHDKNGIDVGIGLGLTIKSDWYVGYTYGINRSSHQIQLQRRLFKFGKK